MMYMMTEAQHAQIVDALNIGIAKHYDLAEDALVGDALAMLKAMQPAQPTAMPFVPWSKEAEMLESWVAQPVAQPLPMTDEEYTHLTTAGAKAWAGVNARELREGGPVAQPLTIQEVEQILAQHDYELHGDRARYIVRMTELAHGIGAKEHGTP